MKLIKLIIIITLLYIPSGLNALGEDAPAVPDSPSTPSTPTTPTDPDSTPAPDNPSTSPPPATDEELEDKFVQSGYDWMNASFDTIGSLFSACIEVPQFSNVLQSSTSVNLGKSNKWVSTGVNVIDGNMLGINWTTKGVLPRPTKYKVIYRIDPRFEKPQVFIQKFDNKTKKYVSDFNHYKDGILLRYQDTPEMTFTDRIVDIPGFFNFAGRDKISVQKGDVINISIIDSNTFFGDVSEMKNELGTLDNLLVLYSKSSIDDNKIIYTNATQFCADAITPARPEYAHNCAQAGFYWDVGDNWMTMEGRILNPAFNLNKSNLLACSSTANGKDNIPLCYYDQGRGVELTVGGTTVKAVNDKFFTSSFTGKSFFYYKSEVSGDLEFTTKWLIDGMYNGHSQFMKDWGAETDYTTFQNNLNAAKPAMTMNFLHFGRYFMEIEIGSSESILSQEDLTNIKLEYIIKSDGIPSESDSGTAVDQIYKGNAPESGFLFVRAISSDESLTGSLNVNFMTYTGSGWFSDLIYTKLIDPLRQSFNSLTMQLYHKFVTNIVLHNIARTMIIIYIIFYALSFLAGATQITVSDMVMRIIKIIIVITLFSENSWTFFNENLFNMFTLGIDSLMSQVTGVTSSVGNAFGFIDPILDRYTNPTIFALLFIQALQLSFGFLFFVIIVLYAMWIYFRAIMEVIISYCLAIVGMSVMISLAPFFITFMLFERTKGMFDNWLSLLFNYMILPTILLVFFLLIEQILSEQLLRVVLRGCWGILIPLAIHIDLNMIGIPLVIDFTLPFLPGIPFFVPDITLPTTLEDILMPTGTIMSIATAAFIIFTMSKLAKGLVEYVTAVVQALTQVNVGGRPSEDGGKDINPVKNIMSDMGKAVKPVQNAARKVGNFAKEKGIDQKITHRDKLGGGGKEPNYSKFSEGGSGRPSGGGSENQRSRSNDSNTGNAGIGASPASNPNDSRSWKAATPKGMENAKAARGLGSSESGSSPWKAATPKGMEKDQIKGANTVDKEATKDRSSVNKDADKNSKTERTDTIKSENDKNRIKENDSSKSNSISENKQDAAIDRQKPSQNESKNENKVDDKAAAKHTENRNEKSVSKEQVEKKSTSKDVMEKPVKEQLKKKVERRDSKEFKGEK